MHQHTFDITWDVLCSNAFGHYLLFLVGTAFLCSVIANCRLTFLFIQFVVLIFCFCLLLQISTSRKYSIIFNKLYYVQYINLPSYEKLIRGQHDPSQTVLFKHTTLHQLTLTEISLTRCIKKY